MANKQYKVLAKSFINNKLHEKGDIVSLDFPAKPKPGDSRPGSNLEEIKAKKAAKSEDEAKDEG